MGRLIVVERGGVGGTCAACGESGWLRLSESRYRRTPRELLTTTWDPQVVHLLTCGHCTVRYPVSHIARVPVPAVCDQDSPRLSQVRPSRDWAYPVSA